MNPALQQRPSTLPNGTFIHEFWSKFSRSALQPRVENTIIITLTHHLSKAAFIIVENDYPGFILIKFVSFIASKYFMLNGIVAQIRIIIIDRQNTEHDNDIFPQVETVYFIISIVYGHVTMKNSVAFGERPSTFIEGHLILNFIPTPILIIPSNLTIMNDYAMKSVVKKDEVDLLLFIVTNDESKLNQSCHIATSNNTRQLPSNDIPNPILALKEKASKHWTVIL